MLVASEINDSTGQCVLWAHNCVGEAPRIALDVDPDAAATVIVCFPALIA